MIVAAKDAGLHEALAKFLKMARKLKKEKIDTELALALARINRLGELEELIAQPNQAKLQDVGEIAFTEGRFDAAKLCFLAGNNYARLSSTLVRLKQYAAAVDAARKANALGGTLPYPSKILYVILPSSLPLYIPPFSFSSFSFL